jgi:hypothetical protein
MRYDYSIIKQAQKLFPDDSALHTMLKSGDPKAVDLVYSKIGFYIDEDDILRAFRNKKEKQLVEMAQRAKSIRDLYQKIYSQVSLAACYDEEAEEDLVQ